MRYFPQHAPTLCPPPIIEMGAFILPFGERGSGLQGRPSLASIKAGHVYLEGLWEVDYPMFWARKLGGGEAGLGGGGSAWRGLLCDYVDHDIRSVVCISGICVCTGRSPGITLDHPFYTPYEGVNLANQNCRKLGILDRKLEGSHSPFYRNFDKYSIRQNATIMFE